MRTLVVLYDDRCGLCCRLRVWAMNQPMEVELKFLAAGSPLAQRLFPTLASSLPDQPVEELIAIDDEGGVYRESDAWILCLYALRNYREWSLRLARPELRPLARQFFQFISRNRSGLSRLIGLRDEELELRLESERSIGCELGARQPGPVSGRASA